MRKKLISFETVMNSLDNFWKGLTKDVIIFDLIINDLK